MSLSPMKDMRGRMGGSQQATSRARHHQEVIWQDYIVSFPIGEAEAPC